MSISIAETRDLDACFELRRVVFIEEQGVSLADERDGRDDEAVHLLVHHQGEPIGTARILVSNDVAKIGRVCVLKHYRGNGHGSALVEACCAAAAKRPGVTMAKLGAQTHAIGFYEALGFTAEGPVYDDAGIPHRDMTRAL
ncbi:GNAT family N-acetyltransferase [Ponticoccus sp. SC2-23]|uniref:GNAT family N-acetyltransferase n=1 Tax=Alexandriicola marinus TaxID=2081710 RepID=UPI000FDBFC88|nr:GNAT family N-acetyltransferase [Alexandriicola marinus]MBM1220628.1 GNAT family N-acetyltransferase [Ponticoccus sp. SC6-9]MBM1225314.1 GNAT family N-acetyltransferase [Ponticoccus sp. SC6-15]MBM1228828.1 GNAT family N-acetyltransferase [Ponticoccus sp. SC6-38]MBM1233535.1 GNAT family N-acetyltransferase [Ponticoccus sp. SC6-45]MBM1239329.1 GNAT family N-acetyltransferase [Ponticoccus sp. SC6-49]MBM1243111.1 GNAT family N-acetyltransferase [Ponticoccus sp. SC2-64]MBM1247059.1 GNAT family